VKSVIWSEAAIADLRDVQTYLGEIDADIAQEAIDRIVLSAEWLCGFPGAGSPVGYRQWRKWPAKATRYLLIYRPTLKGIEIVRVRHERNDWRPQTP
jgi:plasmid stabilization system protein ParE